MTGMSMSEAPAYGLWSLVIINSLIFIIFAFSFTRPKTKRDWRSLGGFAAFIVALFTEMYGFPLTIYLLSGWLASRYPGLDLYSHNAGHLWSDLLGSPGDPHLSPIHIISSIMILAGLYLLATAWNRAVQGAAEPYAGNDRTLCSRSPPSVRCLHIGHAGVPSTVAYDIDFDNVSNSCLDVQEARKPRGKRNSGGIWGSVF